MLFKNYKTVTSDPDQALRMSALVLAVARPLTATRPPITRHNATTPAFATDVLLAGRLPEEVRLSAAGFLSEEGLLSKQDLLPEKHLLSEEEDLLAEGDFLFRSCLTGSRLATAASPALSGFPVAFDSASSS